VGNNFSADTRKALGTNAVGDALSEWIAAYPLWLRLVPGANTAKFQPVTGSAPNGDDVEREPSGNIRGFLDY
jgi:hypothetical protein